MTNEIYFGTQYNLHDFMDAISNSCVIVDEIFRDVEDELVRNVSRHNIFYKISWTKYIHDTIQFIPHHGREIS